MRQLFVVLLVVSLLGCGGPAGEPQDTAQADDIDFTAETVGGGRIDMADYSGQPLALWFWSPW